MTVMYHVEQYPAIMLSSRLMQKEIMLTEALTKKMINYS